MEGCEKLSSMSLYKRGKIWWFAIEYQRRLYQRSTKLTNKNDAIKAESAFRLALIKGDAGIADRKRLPGFREAMADFLKWSENAHQESSHRRYRVSSVALLHFFKDASLTDVTADEIERFKTVRIRQFTTVRAVGKRKQTDQRIKPATVNRELACLRAMFTHISKAHPTLQSRFSHIKPLKEDSDQTRVLLAEEETKYLGAATPLLRDVAMMMLQTGMRPEEVYRIQPENVHLSKAYLFNPFGKTRAARRRINLTKAALKILKRRMDGRQGPYLFPHDSDPQRPVPKVNNAHDRAVRDSGVAKFRLYDLRHTWATRAVEVGIDLVTLAAMLGHSKINMVLRYAHPSQAHQQRATQKIEEFLTQQDQRASTIFSTLETWKQPFFTVSR
jgi:integrase